MGSYKPTLMKLIGQVLGLLFTMLAVTLGVATPTIAVWLASSLVAFHGGRPELALAAAVLLFPVLPLVWDWRASRSLAAKRQQVASRRQFGVKRKEGERLGFFTRLTLRTLFLSVAFIAVLMVWFPTIAFASLATRGDWFLDQPGTERTQLARKTLFAAASGLEWLHRLANPNPYALPKDEQRPLPDDITPTKEEPTERIARRWIPGTAQWKQQQQHPEETTPDEVQPQPEPPPKTDEPADHPAWNVGEVSWPQPNTPRPSVLAITAADETSIDSVGRYFAAAERDPFQRVKALHDWVVTRLRYDFGSLPPNPRQPQDAVSVFQRRSGVCEGYARLLVALGKVTGDEFEYVTGEVRDDTGAVMPTGHAWNAVRINGAWYLVDATWDDPSEASRPTDDKYRTDYLFIPPSVAVLDHFPERAAWQLLAHPLDRGEFMRQPFSDPGLAKNGLTLVSPQRATVELDDTAAELDVEIQNPRRLNVMLAVSADEKSTGEECAVSSEAVVKLRCKVPARGKAWVSVYVSPERYGMYDAAAKVTVVRR